MQTAAGDSSARGTPLCVLGQKELVQCLMELCQLPWHSLSHIRRVPGIPMAFRDTVIKRTGDLEDSLEPPGGQAGLPKLQVYHLAPMWMKLQRLDCFSWGPSPLSYSFFPHVCERRMILVTVFDSSKPCNKLDTSERCNEYFCFSQNWAVHHLTLRSVQ